MGSSRESSREREEREKQPKRKKRRNSKWDETGFSSALEEAAARAQAFRRAPPPTGKSLSFPTTKRQQREVFVGNLASGEVNEADIRAFFLGIFEQIPEYREKYSNLEVIRDIRLNGEGKFGFVEFLDDELANTAMKLDGTPIKGKSAKVGRPRDYVVPAPGTEVGSLSLDGIPGIGMQGQHRAASGTSEKIKRELYIGNLPEGVNADMLKVAYGRIMDENCSPDDAPAILDYRVGKTGNFAFLEFRSEELATKGLTVLANIPIFGRELKISRPAAYGREAGGGRPNHSHAPAHAPAPPPAVMPGVMPHLMAPAPGLAPAPFAMAAPPGAPPGAIAMDPQYLQAQMQVMQLLLAQPGTALAAAPPGVPIQVQGAPPGAVPLPLGQPLQAFAPIPTSLQPGQPGAQVSYLPQPQAHPPPST